MGLPHVFSGAGNFCQLNLGDSGNFVLVRNLLCQSFQLHSFSLFPADDHRHMRVPVEVLVFSGIRECPKKYLKLFVLGKSYNRCFREVLLIHGRKYADVMALDASLYNQVIDFLSHAEDVSISLLQRKFRIGYNRSARIIEMLEMQGRIMPPDGTKSRKVIH